MSFRARLFLFFVIIVVVPMIAVALVLFSLTEDSETGKADAQIAQGLRVAFGEYADARAARTRVRRLIRRYRVDAIGAYDTRGRQLAYAGDPEAIAPAVARPATPEGERLGAVAVSTTNPDAFVRRVSRLTALDVRMVRRGRLL